MSPAVCSLFDPLLRRTLVHAGSDAAERKLFLLFTFEFLLLYFQLPPAEIDSYRRSE